MPSRRATLLVLASTIASACRPGDSTITRGADGDRDWARRLATAVRIGTSADSARGILERNGFTCSAGQDSVAYVQCDKERNRRTVVYRRWRAVLNLDHGRVTAVKASTGLVGS